MVKLNIFSQWWRKRYIQLCFSSGKENNIDDEDEELFSKEKKYEEESSKEELVVGSVGSLVHYK